MNQEIIGKYIAKKRKEKNLTQQELADRIGVTYQAISKWENGRGMPDYTYFESLCKELDITTSELLSGGEKEDKTIDYIKHKDKKDRRILIYVILSALVIIALLIVNHYLTYKNFYKTNYDKTQVTKLYGSGELFDISDILVITSPSKTIMVTGKIITKDNTKVPEDNIIGYSISSEDDLIVSKGGPYTSLMPTVLEEMNGYDEIFTKEKLDNLDKWIVTVYYKDGKDQKSEVINLEQEEVLTTDKYEREEIEPISNSDNQPIKYDYSELRPKLIEKGFQLKGSNMYELEEKDYAILFQLDVDSIEYFNPKTHKRIIYLYFMQNNFEKGGVIYSYPSPERFLISYEIRNNTIICNEDQGSKCSDTKIVEEEKKDIKEKLEIIKGYLN